MMQSVLSKPRILEDQLVLDDRDNMMQAVVEKDQSEETGDDSFRAFGISEDILDGVPSDPGQPKFSMSKVLGGSNMDEKGADHTTSTTISASEDIMHELKGFSRHLRRGGDHSDLIDSVQKIARSQLENVQSMKKMHQNRDKEGLAQSVKSFIGGTTALAEATNHSFKDNHLALPAADFDHNFIDVLTEIPNSDITKFLEPQLFDNVIVQMQDVVTILEDVRAVLHPSSASHRGLKANLFSEVKKDDKRPFQINEDHSEFGSSGKSQFGAGSWDFAGSQDMYMAKEFHQTVGTTHLPDIGKFIHGGNDADSANRRLKVKESHTRRLEAMEVCHPTCLSNDVTCNCNRLVGCIESMSDYDIALLFVGQYIDESSSVPTELRLFDADFNIVGRIESIRNLASANDCSRLLPELHSACNPLAESCSGVNSYSFQLSVDDICNRINTDTKLSFTSISDELDGYWADNGMKSSVTTCHGRLASTSCQAFVKEFDLLYQGRDMTKFPSWNPLRSDPMIAIAESNFFQLPTSYKFEKSVHGINELATYTNNKVRVISSMTKCMSVNANNQVIMENCTD
ncbi:hypothetical protein ACHAW6_002962, partial [Cyclotella cf. meneghiniana]